MSDEITSFGKIGAGLLALGTIISAAAKGIFVTKGECRRTSSLCNKRLEGKLHEIGEELKHGHEQFKNAERWIVALASKQGIKEEDIPKL